ncbi:MAG: hypothetical protein ACREX3_08055 [Gammaproteobacteria bacterium]
MAISPALKAQFQLSPTGLRIASVSLIVLSVLTFGFFDFDLVYLIAGVGLGIAAWLLARRRLRGVP